LIEITGLQDGQMMPDQYRNWRETLASACNGATKSGTAPDIAAECSRRPEPLKSNVHMRGMDIGCGLTVTVGIAALLGEVPLPF
jgi:hypothetical protein